LQRIAPRIHPVPASAPAALPACPWLLGLPFASTIVLTRGIADIACFDHRSITEAEAFTCVSHGRAVYLHSEWTLNCDSRSVVIIGPQVSDDMRKGTTPASICAWYFAWRDSAWSDSSTYQPCRHRNQRLHRSTAVGALNGVVLARDGADEVGCVSASLAAVGVDGHTGSPVVPIEPAPEPAPEPSLGAPHSEYDVLERRIVRITIDHVVRPIDVNASER
jgi:hypothetical protein